MRIYRPRIWESRWKRWNIFSWNLLWIITTSPHTKKLFRPMSKNRKSLKIGTYDLKRSKRQNFRFNLHHFHNIPWSLSKAIFWKMILVWPKSKLSCEKFSVTRWLYIYVKETTSEYQNDYECTYSTNKVIVHRCQT